MRVFEKILILGFMVFSFSLEAAFTFEFKGGAPINVNLPMYYWIQGRDEVNRIPARYYSEPFKEAPYYALRFGSSDEQGNSWEFELIHHKIILENVPSDFRSFNISHGYNFVLINRLWKETYFSWRLGAGIILAHPEIVLDDGSKEPWVEGTLVGFYVAGIGFQVAIERKWYPIDRLFVCPEIKLTLGQAQVDHAKGWANAPNIALHFTLGVGYEF